MNTAIPVFDFRGRDLVQEEDVTAIIQAGRSGSGTVRVLVPAHGQPFHYLARLFGSARITVLEPGVWDLCLLELSPPSG
mgnify:CR=1 FL=1